MHVSDVEILLWLIKDAAAHQDAKLARRLEMSIFIQVLQAIANRKATQPILMAELALQSLNVKFER